MAPLKTLNIRSVKHLAMRLNSSKPELERLAKAPLSHYRTFEKKLGDKKRSFAEPFGRMKTILSKLKLILQNIPLPNYVHGGVKGKSTVTNALPHTRKAAIQKFDIKDFFGSIDQVMVYRLFNKTLGCSREVSQILTSLTTLNDSVPLGSPTSTVVANLVECNLARRVHGLAESRGKAYTQYVDDGTLSGRKDVRKCLPLIERIAQQEGFELSDKEHKRAFLPCHENQLVTGIKVNNGIDVPPEFLRATRRTLKELEKQKDADELPGSSAVASLRGKIQHVSRLNPGAGKALKQRLHKILKTS